MRSLLLVFMTIVLLGFYAQAVEIEGTRIGTEVVVGTTPDGKIVVTSTEGLEMTLFSLNYQAGEDSRFYEVAVCLDKTNSREIREWSSERIFSLKNGTSILVRTGLQETQVWITFPVGMYVPAYKGNGERVRMFDDYPVTGAQFVFG